MGGCGVLTAIVCWRTWWCISSCSLVWGVSASAGA